MPTSNSNSNCESVSGSECTALTVNSRGLVRGSNGAIDGHVEDRGRANERPAFSGPLFDHGLRSYDRSKVSIRFPNGYEYEEGAIPNSVHAVLCICATQDAA